MNGTREVLLNECDGQVLKLNLRVSHCKWGFHHIYFPASELQRSEYMNHLREQSVPKGDTTRMLMVCVLGNFVFTTHLEFV